ncbi:acyltransferase [Anaerobacillus sp. CMMVII]|uniref:acyltransferase family protein n=1 Tax=Anaerobacillus sp. CMMVII TaxID=2755588 RepID=UPI0021B6EBC0|nr:acyltransferase [Anaerobacillus sp. CMMVII]MCT8137622.1 acyltransferase [Anaerobacillus sp. CMMVII]
MRKLYSNFLKTNNLLEGNVSIYLDFIRGISAILVVMEHLSSRLFVGYGNVENPTIFVQLLHLLNMLGGPAVIIFFVLSGVFISRSVLKAFYERKWAWKSYLINRFSRLYVVLIPALILTFILDGLTANFFEFQRYGDAITNLTQFVGNLFFLQNVFVGTYGTNYPLWSLSYEFWYYMLFPLILLLFSKQGKMKKAIYLIITVLIVSSIGTRMNSYFFIWLAGTVVILLPSINILKRWYVPIIALILVIVASVVRPLVMTGRLFTNEWTTDLIFVDIFIALVFGFFVYSLLQVPFTKFHNVDLGWLGKFSRLIAGFSFSLYVIHYPIINMVYRWGAMNGYGGLQPTIFSFIVELLLVTLLCIIAYLFSKLTEAQTPKVRKFLESKTNAFINRERNKQIRKESIPG